MKINVFNVLYIVIFAICEKELIINYANDLLAFVIFFNMTTFINHVIEAKRQQ